MNFLEALKTATQVIREQRQSDEIYLYEINSQMRVYLKDCEGSLRFVNLIDKKPLIPQIFLGGVVDKRERGTSLSLEIVFSDKWEVRLRKTEHLRAELKPLGKTKEQFIDYTPVDKKDKEEELK